MKKLLFLTILSVGLLSIDAFAESKILGSWFQKSTNVTFTITSEGKNYSVSQQFPTGETKTYKLVPIKRSGTDPKGIKLQRKDDDPGVFFRLPETYFINEDGSLTVNYSAESASLPPVR